MPRCLAAASIAAIALFAAVPGAHAASFDCSRAATGVEATICENGALSALDDQMAQNYRALLNRTSGATKTRIRAEQKSWLGQRNACGADARCLNGQYRARIQNIASSGGADAPRTMAATQPAGEEKPRGVFGGFFDRDGRATEPAPTRAAKPVETPAAREPAEDKPGLIARLITRMTPKEEEPEAKATAQLEPREQAQPPSQPMKIIGQRPITKTAPTETEPLVAVEEPRRQKSVVRITSEPEQARQKTVRTEPEPEPELAPPEPARQKFVLRPAVEQPQVVLPAPERQIAAREQPRQQGKWQDLPTGSSFAAPEAAPRTTTARTETARDTDTTRVKTVRIKPEPVNAPAPVETPALTYAPENIDEPPAQRILRTEPRVQMIKPLIVRDRPPATEPSEPAFANEAPLAPVDDSTATSVEPELQPVAQDAGAPAPEDNMPELAALPGDGSALPLDAETAAPASPVREALKSRFDTAYGSANRIDLLAPLRQTRRFDPSRFDIFDEPAGG